MDANHERRLLAAYTHILKDIPRTNRMELIEPEFAPSTWKSFRLLVLEERPAADVAESLGLSVNAVLIAKSRVLRRLRQEGRGLIA